jgi:hypothetical protein
MKTLLFTVLTLVSSQIVRAGDTNVVFGLTNVSIGQAVLLGNVVTNLSSNGLHGVSIFLGEADSGVFAAPDTTSAVSDGDYMIGRAYGKLNGVPDQIVCSVRGRRLGTGSGSGIYPVAVDFSALGVSGFRAQVFSRGGVLKAETLLETNEPVMHTEFNGYKIERVNPFWRTPEGGIAVVLEFGGSTGFELPGQQIYPPPGPDSFIPFGKKLVIHALNPTGVVEYISRVDITSGGDPDTENSDGIDTFQMNDMRPGYFGRAHRALDDVVFSAAGGVVKVIDPTPDGVIASGAWNMESPPANGGVLVEFDRASEASIALQPVELPDNTNSSFTVSAVGTLAGGFLFGREGHNLGFTRLRRGSDSVLLDGLMPPLETNAQEVRVAVYDSGTLAGRTPVLEGDGQVAPMTLTGNPRITSVRAVANNLRSVPALSMTFDTNTTIVITNGTESYSFTGNEVMLLSVGQANVDFPQVDAWFESVDGVALLSTGLPEFTIVGEQEQPQNTPRLHIERVGEEVRLSWLDPNRVYTVRTSSVLTPIFDDGQLEVSNTNGLATAVTSIQAGAIQFFRLVHTRADWE